MEKTRKEKKQKDQSSEKEVLVAIAALEEIVTAEMPKHWAEEEEEE